MPLTSEEVLAKLVEATAEAKDTTRDLHSARGVALDVLKKQRQAIRDAIAGEADRVIAEMSEELRDRMRRAADEIILGIERDWRTALGLNT